MKIFKAREREETEIPIDEVFRNGESDLFPEVQNRKYFDIKFKGRKLTVAAGKYIGLIRLNEKVAIEVQPKTPVRNLLQILALVDGQIHTLRTVTREYGFAGTVPNSILEGMAEAFVVCLRGLEVDGLLKRYVCVTAKESSIKGRIDFQRSVQECWSQGKRHTAVSSYYELSADIYENRLLRYACQFLLVRSFERLMSSQLSAQLGYFDELLSAAGVMIDRSVAIDLPPVAETVSDEYILAMRLAKAIVTNQGIELQSVGQDITLPSFLVDMETVFEKYVRVVLKANIRTHFVMDGNTDGAKPLFDDRRTPPANPDIVIGKDSTLNLVAAVKYKLGHSREDLNQVIAYGLSYKVPNVLLVLPVERSADSGVTVLGSLKGITIYKCGIQLNTLDLVGEERTFGESVTKILEGKFSECSAI